MTAPLPPGSDFLLSKTDAELRYVAQNPTYYHADLVTVARQELQRRGVAVSRPQPVASAPAATYADEAPTRHWLVPAVAVGLALAGAVFFLRPPATILSARPPSNELTSVPTRRLPSFDSLTTAQVQQMPVTLPGAELADTAARRKFLLLARRYWLAENASNYLFEQVVTEKLDGTFPGQAAMTLDKWRHLTSVLVYDHRLPPTMARQLRLMRHLAFVRRSTISEQVAAYQTATPVLTQYAQQMQDSVLYLRRQLLPEAVGQTTR